MGLIDNPLGGGSEQNHLIRVLRSELYRKEPRVIGWRFDETNWRIRFIASLTTPWVQVHVQSTKAGEGGDAYNPADSVSSTEVDCREDRLQDVAVTGLDAGERYVVYLIPIEEDGAGNRVLYDGESGRPDFKAFAGIIVGGGVATHGNEAHDPNFATAADLTSHAGSTSNPHSVTKAQVGLGSVENYPVASKAEAEAGAENTRYMTPLRTLEAIEALAGGGMWGEPLVDATLGTSTATWNINVSGLSISDEVRVRFLTRPTVNNRSIFMRINTSTNAYGGYLILADGTMFLPSSTNGVTFTNGLIPSASDIVGLEADVFMRKIRDADWLAGHFKSYAWDPSFVRPRAFRGAFDVNIGAGAIQWITLRATGSGSPLVEAGSRVLIYARSF